MYILQYFNVQHNVVFCIIFYYNTRGMIPADTRARPLVCILCTDPHATHACNPLLHVQAGVSTRQPNGVLGLGLLISLVTISARVVALLCVALAPSDALPSRVVRVTCALCRTFAAQPATSFTWLPLAPVVPAAVHVPAPYMPMARTLMAQQYAR